jgi:hypothetical protein
MKYLVTLFILILACCTKQELPLEKEKVSARIYHSVEEACDVLTDSTKTEYQLRHMRDELESINFKTECELNDIKYDGEVDCDSGRTVYIFDAPDNIKTINKGVELCISGKTSSISRFLYYCFVRSNDVSAAIGECK